MSNTGWIVLGVVAVAIVLILMLRKRLGLFKMKLFGSGIEARSAKSQDGASADDATAGRDINVTSKGRGSASADRAKAGRDIGVKKTGGRG